MCGARVYAMSGEDLRLSVAERTAIFLVCFGVSGAFWAILFLLCGTIALIPIPGWMLLYGIVITACCIVRGIMKARSESWFSVCYIVDSERIEQRLPFGDVKCAEWAELLSVSGPHGNLSTLWDFLKFGLRDLTGFGKPIVLQFSRGIQIEIPRIGIPKYAHDAFLTPMVELSGRESPLYQYGLEYARFVRAQKQMDPTRVGIYLLSVPVALVATGTRWLEACISSRRI